MSFKKTGRKIPQLKDKKSNCPKVEMIEPAKDERRRESTIEQGQGFQDFPESEVFRQDPDSDHLPLDIQRLYRQHGWWTPQDLKYIRRLMFRGIVEM